MYKAGDPLSRFRLLDLGCGLRMAWLDGRDTDDDGSDSDSPGTLHPDNVAERESCISFGLGDVRIDDTS